MTRLSQNHDDASSLGRQESKQTTGFDRDNSALSLNKGPSDNTTEGGNSKENVGMGSQVIKQKFVVPGNSNHTSPLKNNYEPIKEEVIAEMPEEKQK